ncbi:MAG TPA: DUF1993 domain-containing protein [Rhizomicrobium sp.]|jgi:hypothetical protein
MYSLHDMASGAYAAMLRNLSAILDKAADRPELIDARLAPDMYPLAQQVRIACDHAAGTAAQLFGATADLPAGPDRSFAEMKARIAKTIAIVEAAGPAAGAEDKAIEIPLMDDLVLPVNGAQYVQAWAFPNFYFHVVTAYDILRANGIQIGKRDYMAHIGPLIRRK